MRGNERRESSFPNSAKYNKHQVQEWKVVRTIKDLGGVKE